MFFKSQRIEFAKVAIDHSFGSVFNTINFVNNYDIGDITEVEYLKEGNVNVIKFILKKDIMVSISCNIVDLINESSIVAKRKANIEDLIDCTNFIFSYKQENYNVCKNSINQAIKNEGQKIEIPLSKSNSNVTEENYIQVLDDTIYVFSRSYSN